MRIAILGCSKTKVGGGDPVMVRKLYTSPLFQKSLAFAEATSDVVYVASAQHGLVGLSDEYPPYDQTLKGWGKREKLDWGGRVADIVVSRHKLYEVTGEKPVMGVHCVTILAGAEYASPIALGLQVRRRSSSALSLQLSIDTPLAGLQVGERLAWLNAAIEKAQTPVRA